MTLRLLPPPSLSGDALTERLGELNAWLHFNRDLWEPRPFVEWRPRWWGRERELSTWVRTVDERVIEALETDLCAQVAVPRRFRGLRDSSVRRGLVPPLAPPSLERLEFGVKDRKSAQVSGFLAAVGPTLRGGEGPIVEWCSGRGHLGRTLSLRTGRPALLFERDPTLCAPARQAPERPGVRHVRVDVLDDEVHAVLPEQAAYVALHACGRLTDRLLDVALAHGADTIAAAPCCAHRLFGAERYAPRSKIGRASALDFGPDTLRLSVLDDVVASPRQRARRHREHWLRVAVDLLAREATGRDVYWAFPSVPPRVVDLALVDFVAWVERHHGLPVPATWDPERVGRAATEQLRIIRAGALVRSLARRPLEVWLALDRAQSLMEAGFDVWVGAFCARSASPRNLLILAYAG